MINDLPSPPLNRSGWPWTKESKLIPPMMSNGNPWPKISIVTPSYNQGEFLEETIRSVLLQNYPNLEYIIMDGGSTDNSVEIIKKYEKYLTFWTSQKDNGQADAIYRGFEMSTGEIIAWINSDDLYLPNALITAAKYFSRNRKKSLLIGSSYYANVSGKKIKKLYAMPQDFESIFCAGMHFCQPACFWLRQTFFDVNGFDRSLLFAFDYDLFLRLTERQEPGYSLQSLAVFRVHDKAKSSVIPETATKEAIGIREKYQSIDMARQDIIKRATHRLKRLYSCIGMLLDVYYDPKWLFSRARSLFFGTNFF